MIGGSSPPTGDLVIAHQVGELLAEAGATVICGGLGGVMESVCRGAKTAGALTVGILPGSDASAANAWVDVAIPTGMGEARNALVVAAASAVIAIGGEYGTLSEIALALRASKPVVGLSTWSLIRPGGVADNGIFPAAGPREAVEHALALAQGG